MSATKSQMIDIITQFIKDTYIIAIFDNNCFLNDYLEKNNYDYQGFLNKHSYGFCEYIKTEFNNNYDDFVNYNKVCLRDLNELELNSLIMIIDLMTNKKLESSHATKLFNRPTTAKTLYFSKDKKIIIF